MASLPRPVLYGLVVLIVGVGLFAAPFLLKGLTGDGAAASSPTPSASASPTRSPSASITPVPSPSATVYTVKAGDLLSRIAAEVRRHGRPDREGQSADQGPRTSSRSATGS